MMAKVSILGGGESGVGAALLAQKLGYEVFVSDYGSISQNYIDELYSNSIPFEEKGHSIEKIVDSDIIIKSPGIPSTAKVVVDILDSGNMVISEIEFAYRYFDGKIIAVTGSNGKTTTTSWIYHILAKSDYSVGVGGNIGYAFSRLCADDNKYDYLVLELSSFQLENISSFSAEIAVILNITADHLDRYNYSMYKYASAKWNLALAVPSEGLLILKKEDDWLNLMQVAFPVDCKIKSLVTNDNSVAGQSSKEINFSDLSLNLIGNHNAFNGRVAACIASRVGIERSKIIEGLEDFRPLPHRLETLREVGGIKFVNDSKATNVDSVLVALEAIQGSIIWVVGGVDKGNDYSVLNDLVLRKVKAIICLTTDDKKIRSTFENIVHDIRSTTDVDDCVQQAIDIGKSGDIVLLSPACASFDLFDNYIDRGDKFREAVNKI